ncbi:GtrA family protein [Pedobacter nutrimenti]|jgi:dolichol-phosphate mannosyltransferase|uniref:Dolichol-phosphate mannosyltransferase n=1 Tax=Pedobacter nutrimenti TaxID=1241337 RepID=A0A318U7K4_9SPHI|nr:GtrA family protein [Pedobacter nutrimenti]PYF69996.1 dolichol-phosphate mannosyltransferase [Pedobacter nutrimenti]
MPGQKFSFSYLLSLVPERLLSLIKFGITGASGLVIDFSLTWFFKDVLHFNKFLANGIGFTAAVISNYFINKLWTFKNKDKIGKQLAAFILVSLIGLMLNSFFIYLFNSQLLLNFYLSKAIAVVLVFFWNFSANYFFVFKTSKT